MKKSDNVKATLILSFICLFSASADAALPDYTKPALLARANVADGYNLPPMSFITNSSPVINNRGDVSFKVLVSDGESNQGIWLKSGTQTDGKLIYAAPDLRFISDPSINLQGKVAFNQYDEGVTDGIFTIDSDTSVVTNVLKPTSEDIAFYTYPQVLTNGKIYFRGTDQENVRTFFQYDGSLRKIIAEGTSSYGQKSSYLFRPFLNESGSMTFKRRVGETGEWDESNGDEILLLKPSAGGYESVVVARDRDMDPDSVFKGFTNSSSLSQNGMVAFTAYLNDSTKALILYKDGVLRNLVIENSDEISEIELFTPKVNDLGQVVFRARDLEGKRGIYLADISGIKKIIAEGDEVVTDLGVGKILSNPNYPAFGGDVDMNDHGEIVFYCIVVDKDNKEWGSAVYKVSPQL